MGSGFFKGMDSMLDPGPGGGSTVSQKPADYVPPQIIQDHFAGLDEQKRQDALYKRRGFMESMGGWGSGDSINKFARPDMAPMPEAPPPQWGYAQGQGPVWQTPERIGSSTEYQMVNNAPGTPGFYGGKNRI